MTNTVTNAIAIRGYHGRLYKRELLETLNRIAKVESPDYLWNYEGTIGEFAEQWKRPFLSYYFENQWCIYVTDYNSFNTR